MVACQWWSLEVRWQTCEFFSRFLRRVILHHPVYFSFKSGKFLYLTLWFLFFIICADHGWKITEIIFFLKCEIQHKQERTNDHNFHEFVRVLYASTGVQSKNIWLSADYCATPLLETSCLQTVKLLYYPPHCTSIMPSTRIGYGQSPRRSASVFTNL